MCKDLGSSPMCVTWMLFKLCVFFCVYMLNVRFDDKLLEL